METDATRMCALLVGLPDVVVVGVGDWPSWLRQTLSSRKQRADDRSARARVLAVHSIEPSQRETCQRGSGSGVVVVGQGFDAVEVVDGGWFSVVVAS